MLALEGRFRTRGLRVVSTSPTPGDDAAERAAITEAARDENMSYPCFLDEGSAWARQLGLQVRPSFAVIGRDGRVVYHFAGLLTEGTPEYAAMESAIDQALQAH